METHYHKPHKLTSTHASALSNAPDTAPPLSEEHRRMLEEGSGIGAAEIASRGYKSVVATEALAVGFAKEQARNGLLIPFYTPTGEISYQLRPEKPRVIKGKSVKYETRQGQDIVLDVHPSNYWRLINTGEPIYVIEGIKKADCAATLGRLAVGLSGTWNWGKKRKRGGAKYGKPELLPDWEPIPLEGREVFICFDADYREKQSVALAMLRLAERLTERGARVYIMDLPGPEKGLDDYIVAGGDLDTLEADARPFTASDLIRYAAKRDRRIWNAVAATLDRMRVDDWTERGAETTHSLMRALLEVVLLSGRVHRGGVVDVLISTRELRQYAAIGSLRTLSRHIEKLQERGYIERVSGDRAKGRANRYVLKLSGRVSPIEGGRGRTWIPPYLIPSRTN
jgi:hypothetical protein